MSNEARYHFQTFLTKFKKLEQWLTSLKIIVKAVKKLYQKSIKIVLNVVLKPKDQNNEVILFFLVFLIKF